MSVEDVGLTWCDEYGIYVDLPRLIMLASPFVSVFNSKGGLISADLAEPTLVPHSCGLALSLSIDDIPSLKPSTLVIWTVSSTVPRWMLPVSLHPDLISGHLYVSLSCSTLEPIAKDIYLARQVVIKSNLLYVGYPNLERIVQWLFQCDDSSKQAVADVFRAWQRSNGVLH